MGKVGDSKIYRNRMRRHVQTHTLETPGRTGER